jgi:hypothetical protein
MTEYPKGREPHKPDPRFVQFVDFAIEQGRVRPSERAELLASGEHDAIDRVRGLRENRVPVSEIGFEPDLADGRYRAAAWSALNQPAKKPSKPQLDAEVLVASEVVGLRGEEAVELLGKASRGGAVSAARAEAERLRDTIDRASAWRIAARVAHRSPTFRVASQRAELRWRSLVRFHLLELWQTGSPDTAAVGILLAELEGVEKSRLQADSEALGAASDDSRLDSARRRADASRRRESFLTGAIDYLRRLSAG